MFNSEEKNEFKKYCQKLSADNLLFQGAGGNTSIKSGKSLLIKASGKWMSNSLNDKIFVIVNLEDLTNNIKNNHFNSKIHAIDNDLKPSIETMLHAIMPQKYVFHMHMIEVLKDLVCLDGFERISSIMKNQKNWIWIDYFTPGPKLAKALKLNLSKVDYNPNIVFLQNHGVVIGGNTLDEIDLIIKNLKKLFTSKINYLNHKLIEKKIDKIFYKEKKLKPFQSDFFNFVVFNEKYYNYLLNNWALYPDHVVFLGKKPLLLCSVDDLISKTNIDPNIELVFVKNVGVFYSEKFSLAKIIQLECYINLLIRVEENSILKNLSDEEVNFLIDWEDEKYRKNI